MSAVWDEIEVAVRTAKATVWQYNGPTWPEVDRIATKYGTDRDDVMDMAKAAWEHDEYPRPRKTTPPNASKARHPLQCPHCGYRAKKPRGLAIHIGRDHESPGAKMPINGGTQTPEPEPQPAPEPEAAPEPAAAPECMIPQELVDETFDLADASCQPEPDEAPGCGNGYLDDGPMAHMCDLPPGHDGDHYCGGHACRGPGGGVCGLTWEPIDMSPRTLADPEQAGLDTVTVGPLDIELIPGVPFPPRALFSTEGALVVPRVVPVEDEVLPLTDAEKAMASDLGNIDTAIAALASIDRTGLPELVIMRLCNIEGSLAALRRDARRWHETASLRAERDRLAARLAEIDQALATDDDEPDEDANVSVGVVA